MTTIHFIGQEHNKGQATGVYHLTINGKAYTYNRATDSLKNMAEGCEILRKNLPGDVLRALHQAWDPDAYADAIATPPLDENGIPDDSENPESALYYPAKPQGEPMELRPGHATTVDLADIIAQVMAEEGEK